MMKKATILESYFGTIYSSSDPVNDRQKRSDTQDTRCQGIHVETAPKMIKDVDDVERIIANTEMYRQLVTFEICG